MQYTALARTGSCCEDDADQDAESRGAVCRLVMGSRCGDMDPAVVLYMMQKVGLSAQQVDVLMNKKSGFLGMCGHADVRAVLQAADAGDEKAQLAVEACYPAIA